MPPGTRQIGIFLFDHFEELDAVGPYEVFGAWSTRAPEDGWSVRTMSMGGVEVRGANGLVIRPDEDAQHVGHLDVLVYPGGKGTRALLANRDHLEWVRSMRASVPLLASVCTGSLVLAAAGLLTGRPATTHWASLDYLASLDPTIDVRRDARFVDDGDTVTSAGVSAGIDMALHLVGRLASPERAREVRHLIEYDPAPPF